METTLSLDPIGGNCRNFIEPSAPQENNRPDESKLNCQNKWCVSVVRKNEMRSQKSLTWLTPFPCPIERKNEERECSAGNAYKTCCVARLHTYRNINIQLFEKKNKQNKTKNKSLQTQIHKTRYLKNYLRLKFEPYVSFLFFFCFCFVKSNSFTLISPSAEPVTKNSSLGSRAMHLTATEDSWAVNLWRSVRCLKSHRQTSPLRPADINSWCWPA